MTSTSPLRHYDGRRVGTRCAVLQSYTSPMLQDHHAPPKGIHQCADGTHKMGLQLWPHQGDVRHQLLPGCWMVLKGAVGYTWLSLPPLVPLSGHGLDWKQPAVTAICGARSDERPVLDCHKLLWCHTLGSGGSCQPLGRLVHGLVCEAEGAAVDGQALLGPDILRTIFRPESTQSGWLPGNTDPATLPHHLPLPMLTWAMHRAQKQTKKPLLDSTIQPGY